MQIRPRLKTTNPENDFERALEKELLSAWLELSTLVNKGLLAQASIGDTTNYMSIDTSGKITFVGTAGLAHGSCYGNTVAWSQVAAVQNTWYPISDTDMTDGQLLNVSHDGSGKITVTSAGKYLVNYSASVEDDTNNDHVQLGIRKEGSMINDGMNRAETKKANDHLAISGTAIVDCAAGDTIEIAIRTTDANTPTLGVDSLNITVLQIAGT